MTLVGIKECIKTCILIDADTREDLGVCFTEGNKYTVLTDGKYFHMIDDLEHDHLTDNEFLQEYFN